MSAPLRRARPLLPLALLLTTLPLLTAARAATRSVPSQYATIQAAVNAAVTGDTVLVADGTYAGTGNRDIDLLGKSLTVKSVHGAAKTVIDCGGASGANHRGFYIHGGETRVTVQGFTVKNGHRIADNAHGGFGGGVCILNYGGAITVTDCTFTGNSTQDGGGGVYALNAGTGGSITLTRCTVTNNKSNLGGGVSTENTGTGTITLTGCTFTNNTGSYDGGGVYDYNHDGSTGTVTVTACAFSGNTATYNYGGGVCCNNGTGAVAVTGCAFSGNKALGGGGFYTEFGSGPVTLTNCSFTGNQAIGNFGDANDGGGGVYSQNSDGTLAVINSLFYGNVVLYGNGGGILSLRGGTFTNCLFVGNTALGGEQEGGYGGGILAVGSARLTNCTLVSNSVRGAVGSGGGGAFIGGGTFTNDILYGNSSEDGPGDQIANGGFNAPTVFHCDVQGGFAGTANIDADPLFVRSPSLSVTPPDYGNLHIPAGSPCTGKGTRSGAPGSDKNGRKRPNPPAIGAYEPL